ncbi:MAG: hypothetical protein ACNA7W_20180 [Pseudomonadales bacterium]
MAQLKTGARLKSVVCDGEVMVVAAPAEAVEITCGGAPMVADAAGGERLAVDPEHGVGIRIGKRYVSESGDLELLCVKSGEGGLAANGSLLLQKDTKKLPKTD